MAACNGASERQLSGSGSRRGSPHLPLAGFPGALGREEAAVKTLQWKFRNFPNGKVVILGQESIQAPLPVPSQAPCFGLSRWENVNKDWDGGCLSALKASHLATNAGATLRVPGNLSGGHFSLFHPGHVGSPLELQQLLEKAAKRQSDFAASGWKTQPHTQQISG